MVKTNMVKNIKKRSASQSETIEKKTEISGNFNKNIKKKKTGNETVQNGQTNKNNIANKLKNEQNKNKNKNAAIIQNTNKKQTNDVTSKKRKTQPPTIENKLELLTKRQEYRERRKTNRRIKHGTSLDLSTEDIKEKIQLIEKRDELTKTAKRKLASLRKKLKVEEGTDKPKQDDKIPSKKAKNEKSLEAIKTEKVQNNEQKKKLVQKVENKNKEKDTKQSNSLPLKKKNKDKAADDDKEVDQDDDEVETDDELSEDEDESDVEEEEDENSDDDDDDDEEEEEDEGKKDKSNKQDKDSNVKKGNIQNLEEKAKPKNAEEESKKKRYVLFVGNLPYSITNEELKKHFLTKVNHIVDIRIPKKDDDTSRGFAYVELSNNTDYEKALSLNHSFVNGRRIKVQYSGNNKKVGVAKNFKLHALQKAGKLASGKNRNNQKYAGNKRKQNMQTTKT